MPYISDITKFLESKTDTKNLKITNSEENILLLKIYVKKLKLKDNIRIKELNRVLTVKDLLVLWLRFRTKFNITDISEILSTSEAGARSLIGNALINITQVDLTAQDDKCFFTSAKLPFYLSTEGKLISDLDISKQINKHINSCKYCKSNYKAYQESVKKIANLPVLEQGDAEYVLYHKNTGMKILNKLLIFILALIIISGLFVSPSFKSEFTRISKNVFTKDTEKTGNTQNREVIKSSKNLKNTKKKIAKKTTKIKQIEKVEQEEKTKQENKKIKNTVSPNKITKKNVADLSNKTAIVKLKKQQEKIKNLKNINNTKKNENKYTNTIEVTKFTLSSNFKNSSKKIKNILKKYNAKHFGELKWGSKLNNGYYFHLLIKKTDFENFKNDMNKLGEFTIINSKGKNNRILSGYKRTVIWISNKFRH